MKTDEIWKDVPEYESSYQVSNLGRVRTKDREELCKDNVRTKSFKRTRKGKVLSLNERTNGYLKIDLWKNGKTKTLSIQKLVLLAFIGPQEKGQVTRHLDGNPKNNCLENLCYGTYQENEADKLIHGTRNLGSKVHNSKLTERDILLINKYLNEGGKTTELAKHFDVEKCTISAIKYGRIWNWLTKNKET